MENNKQSDVSVTYPAFVPTAPLNYDLNEIEHQFYMFDHRCVGCVVLMSTRDVKTEVMGRIKLSGRLLENCFWLPISLSSAGNHLSLVIPIRGFVDYSSTYIIRLEGFQYADGTEIEPLEMPLTTRPRPQKNPAYAEHDAVALEAAREGMVLLKNQGGVLPLKPDSVLNLFGEGLTNYRIGATGAGRINPRFSYSLRDAIRETSEFTLNETLDKLYTVPVNLAPDRVTLENAKALSDVAVIVLTRGTGENIDNNPFPGEFYLSGDEEAMIASICGVFEKVVAVLNTGYPIDIRWTEKYKIKALLYAGLAGQASAQALCEILNGRVNPSGKLPDTWAWDYFDHPSSANFLTRKANEKPIMADDDVWVDTCYEEGIYVGYRYFETFRKQAAFPFGHGLSYTAFKIDAQPPSEMGDTVCVTAVVTNTGNVSGKETVMVYAKLPGRVQEQPAKQLAAFKKTKLLAVGESEILTFEIQAKFLASWRSKENAWVLEKDVTEIYAGGDVHNAVFCGSLERPEEKIITRLQHRFPCPVEFDEMSPNGKSWPSGTLTRIRHGAHSISEKLPRAFAEPVHSSAEKISKKITFAELKAEPSLLDDFAAQMDSDVLARLNMMYGHGWSMDGKGEAGRLAPLTEYGLPEFVCADGNCGVNVNNPNIGMPTSVVVCSTFNAELARKVGKVIGEEAVENGIQMILAPGMNIHRNPLCGRHAEYFSEDPYLSGIMAGAQVQGLHDAGVCDCVKHIAANNCETARKRNHSLISERALREIYLRTFETLICHVKPDAIMTGYNALNGCMCGSDPVLIEGVFRDEFGFDGFAMTDWSSYDTVDMVDSVNAGISWLTPGENDGSRTAILKQAVQEGKISRAQLAENAKKVFKIMLRRFAG